MCKNDEWSNMPTSPVIDMETAPSALENHGLAFCPPEVWAFSLKHKSWRIVSVDSLEEVKSNTKALEDLVMDSKDKHVIESLADMHISGSLFSDIVGEKGKGVVVLLHGPPGTGKTLTAECIAEKNRRPLYSVTCGDLGTEAVEVEEHLKNIFQKAVDWKAILLLDEADVFLRERDLFDLKRNAIVSVFLRHIEYFDGILFLTTNRPEQIDAAFMSRIHVSIHLPVLDTDRQMKIWYNFIKRHKLDNDKSLDTQKKSKLLRFVLGQIKPGKGEEEQTRHKGYQMNGRQIRNCIRAASAIAARSGRVLEEQDLKTVMDLGIKFQKDMKRANRIIHDEKASGLGLDF